MSRASCGRLRPGATRVVSHDAWGAGALSVAAMAGVFVASTLCGINRTKSLCVVPHRPRRPSGIISFAKQQDPSEMLSTWGSEIGELLSLVEKTKHLIDREMMAHDNSK